MLRSNPVRIALEDGRRRAAFFFIASIFAGALGAAAIRVALPAQLADSDNFGPVLLAARLDPENDRVQYRLGLREFTAGEFGPARAQFERATLLNPSHPQYWADLGQLCSMTNDFACAAASYDRVGQLAPMHPEYAWDRATYFAVAGRRNQALAAFARYVELSPSGADAAFDSVLRLYDDPNLTWKSVAKPAGANAQMALLTLLASRNQQTAPLWDEIAGTRLPEDRLRAYSEVLLQHRNFALAQRVWTTLVSSGANIASRSSNLIYNPNFGHKPTNSGFDWHVAPRWFIAASAEQADSRPVLRISYTVAQNEDSEPLYEFVAVEPNESYVLSAIVKANDITSTSGPRLRVVDVKCSECLDASSEQVLGSAEWRKIEVRFDTAEKTKFVRVSISRPRARTFPMDITGTLWLSGIELIASGRAAIARASEQVR